MDYDMYDFSDPKRVGPGVWMMWRSMAYRSDSNEERKLICKMYRNLCKYDLKCLECRGHALQYLQDNPPEDYTDDNMSLLDWVMTFMNAVKVRTNKPPYIKEILVRQLKEEQFGVCSQGCGGHGDKKQEEKEPENRVKRRPNQFRLISYR